MTPEEITCLGTNLTYVYRVYKWKTSKIKEITDLNKVYSVLMYWKAQ